MGVTANLILGLVLARIEAQRDLELSCVRGGQHPAQDGLVHIVIRVVQPYAG